MTKRKTSSNAKDKTPPPTLPKNTSSPSTSPETPTASSQDPKDYPELVQPLLKAFSHPSIIEHIREMIPSSKAIANMVTEALEDRLVSLEYQLSEKKTKSDELQDVIIELEHRVDSHEAQELCDAKRFKELNGRIEELEEIADDQEQYSRRTSVRINGVPESEGEAIISVINPVFQAINCHPTINRIHRVGAPRKEGKGPRPILCQFTTYPDKALVMKHRKSLNDSMNHVFINEDLTRKRARVLYGARKLKKDKFIKDAWSYDGRLAIKDNKLKIHTIRKLSDLGKFIPSSCDLLDKIDEHAGIINVPSNVVNVSNEETDL